MTETLRQADDAAQNMRRPALMLAGRQLTLLIGLMLVTPIAVVALLSLILPPAHHRSLPITVDLISEYGKPQMIRLTNTGDVTLQYLRIELNGAYGFFPQTSLPPHEQMDFSAERCMKKTGQHFESDKTELRTIHISARLPGNQRGVLTENLKDRPQANSTENQ